MGQKGTVSGADQESIQVSDKQAPEPGSNTPDETGIPIDSKDLRAQQKRLPNQPRHEPDDQGVRCLLDHHTRPYPPHQVSSANNNFPLAFARSGTSCLAFSPTSFR